VLKAADRLARIVGATIDDEDFAPAAAGSDAIGPLLAHAYPDRIARRRDGSDAGYLLSNGGSARLQEDKATAGRIVKEVSEDREGVPGILEAARVRRWYADVLKRSGDDEAAIRELKKSHEVLASLGAKGEMEHARVMMKQLGMRLPSREGSGTRRVPRLTERETDIARLVAERKSNKEIAVVLGISARTVTTHVANIFSKLGVNSRGELADRIREGLTGAGAGSN
jgi:DNA-binding CsgD family transcriptional regulator